MDRGRRDPTRDMGTAAGFFLLSSSPFSSPIGVAGPCVASRRVWGKDRGSQSCGFGRRAVCVERPSRRGARWIRRAAGVGRRELRQGAWSAALRDRGGGVQRPEVGSRGERDGWLRAASGSCDRDSSVQGIHRRWRRAEGNRDENEWRACWRARALAVYFYHSKEETAVWWSRRQGGTVVKKQGMKR